MNADEMAPEDFRAEIARAGLHHYVVAARLPVHPTRFSRWLWGRERMPVSAKRRLAEVLEQKRGRLQKARS